MVNLSKVYKFLILLCSLFISGQQFVYAQQGGLSVGYEDDDVKIINNLFNQGKWDEGGARAEAILEKSPKDTDIRALVGKYYLHKKQYDRARYEFVKTLEYAPADVEVKHMLVNVETETKRYSSAICYVNELLEVNPYAKGLWRKKIELYRTVGNHVEADRLLRRISHIYPEDVDFRKDQAYVLEQKTLALQKSGKIDEAIDLARKQVSDNPKESAGYFVVIDNYIKAGDYNNALAYADRGINTFPGNVALIQKKIAILEHQKRYAEILSFLQLQMRGRPELSSQYNYFILEAARNAKQFDPANLYGKTFESSPGNKEAFDFLFNDLLAKQQYEEALIVLNKHRKSVGNRKDLDMRELMIYKRIGNQSKVSKLTTEYFAKYPEDVDLKESYITMLSKDARESMVDGDFANAVKSWYSIIEYGDKETVYAAQRGLYNTYVSAARFQEALLVLDDMIQSNPEDVDLLLKKSDLYYKLGNHEYAISLYEEALGAVASSRRDLLIDGYNDILSLKVKTLREEYKLIEAKRLSERWLSMDPKNQDALMNLINISYQLKDTKSMLYYAQLAEESYENDVFFKIKLAQAMNNIPEMRSNAWQSLHKEVQLKPYHEPLVNTFVDNTDTYVAQLLKNKDYSTVLTVVDTVLNYRDVKSLKYAKGLAYEGLKDYDSAYRYQQYFEPSLLELDEFKSHLSRLLNKTYKNNVGISHLRARYGDDYSITSISTVEYTHYNAKGSSFGARVNYAGRDQGKGIQGLVEWQQPLSEKLSAKIDIALSNQYFAKFATNLGFMYAIQPTWQLEFGGGYRRFYSIENLGNINIGIVKTFDDVKLSANLNNFLLDSDGELTYLYSVGAKVQYYMNNPKNYLLGIASVGNSPDIDLLNNQFYNSFNVFNAMVGAGVGRSISKNVGASVMGTWYNFRSAQSMQTEMYKNFYNLYFQLNVSF